MAKKKKKVNLHAQQKLQAAQHKKLFMERLRKICTLIGNGEPLFDLLPPYIRDAVYMTRSATPKFKVERGAKITKRFVKILYRHVEEEMESKFMELKIADTVIRINLVDYRQLVFPLESVLINTAKFSGKEKFDALCVDLDKRYEKYYRDFANIIHNACYAYCDLSKWALYTYTLDAEHTKTIIDNKAYTGMFYQIITLDLYPLDVRYVAIDGNRRPVIQIGEMIHKRNISGLRPTEVSLKRLRIKDPAGDTKIPVYVQQHAIDRTMQRACCVFPGSAISLIDKAFREENKIIRESANRYLVECYEYDIKIGYFVGMFVDGIFVVRTFLLITHSSTPEGRKLSKLTGLQRDDISFLAIDDLKTLINSDIRDNERIARIFIEAGCESILDMNFQLNVYGDYYWLRDEAKQNSELSKMIAEYIQLGSTDEEYFENE
ncbi:MAG: hypothetical protein LBG45_07170 [Dysgonamonadaceae bacterium]|jgi:hypothetical protein|nr:hypothetical protein [Dysgonamonadaceae bacterium]